LSRKSGKKLNNATSLYICGPSDEFGLKLARSKTAFVCINGAKEKSFKAHQKVNTNILILRNIFVEHSIVVQHCPLFISSLR